MCERHPQYLFPRSEAYHSQKMFSLRSLHPSPIAQRVLAARIQGKSHLTKYQAALGCTRKPCGRRLLLMLPVLLQISLICSDFRTRYLQTTHMLSLTPITCYVFAAQLAWNGFKCESHTIANTGSNIVPPRSANTNSQVNSSLNLFEHFTHHSPALSRPLLYVTLNSSHPASVSLVPVFRLVLTRQYVATFSARACWVVEPHLGHLLLKNSFPIFLIVPGGLLIIPRRIWYSIVSKHHSAGSTDTGWVLFFLQIAKKCLLPQTLVFLPPV